MMVRNIVLYAFLRKCFPCSWSHEMEYFSHRCRRCCCYHRLNSLFSACFAGSELSFATWFLWCTTLRLHVISNFLYESQSNAWDPLPSYIPNGFVLFTQTHMTLEFLSVVIFLPIRSYKPMLASNHHPSLLLFYSEMAMDAFCLRLKRMETSR